MGYYFKAHHLTLAVPQLALASKSHPVEREHRVWYLKNPGSRASTIQSVVVTVRKSTRQID